MNPREKPDGLLEALKIVGVAQGLCLKRLSRLERHVARLATEAREGLATLEDIVASRRGCELTPLLSGRAAKPRARLKRKEVRP